MIIENSRSNDASSVGAKFDSLDNISLLPELAKFIGANFGYKYFVPTGLRPFSSGWIHACGRQRFRKATRSIFNIFRAASNSPSPLLYSNFPSASTSATAGTPLSKGIL